MNRRKTIALNWSDSLSCEAQAEGRKGNRAEIYCVRWPKDRTKSAVFLAVFLCLNSCTIHQTININIMPRKTKNETRLTFYNKYNRHLYNSPGSINTEPTKTQPGQGVGIQEMIRMSARGEIPPMAEAAFHGHNVDIDSVDGTLPTDITDIQEKAEQLKALKAAAKQNARMSVAEDEATPRSNTVDEQTAEAEASKRQKAAESQGDS